MWRHGDPFGQHQKDHLAGKELFPISGSSALSKIFEAICLSLVIETYLHSKWERLNRYQSMADILGTGRMYRGQVGAISRNCLYRYRKWKPIAYPMARNATKTFLDDPGVCPIPARCFNNLNIASFSTSFTQRSLVRTSPCFNQNKKHKNEHTKNRCDGGLGVLTVSRQFLYQTSLAKISLRVKKIF